MKFFFWRKSIEEKDTSVYEQQDPYLEKIIEMLANDFKIEQSKLENKKTEKEYK